MIIHLDKSRNRTVAQVREVLEGVYPLEFTAAADSDACSKWGLAFLGCATGASTVPIADLAAGAPVTGLSGCRTRATAVLVGRRL